MEEKRKRIYQLKNGILVGSFCSPHSFVFDDETELPEVPKEEAKPLFLKQSGRTISKVRDRGGKKIEVNTISPEFNITQEIENALDEWQQLYLQNEVDVVICPAVLIQALKKRGEMLYNSPFRGIKISDRVGKICSSKEFYL